MLVDGRRSPGAVAPAPAAMAAMASPSPAAAPTMTGGFDLVSLLFADRCGLICNGTDGTEEHPDGQGGGLVIGNGGDGSCTALSPGWPAVVAAAPAG